MTFGVVIFPGSNCDQDAIYTIASVLRCNVKTIWHQQSVLPELDAIILPGGFSYGDYLRPGAIASRSPIMKAIKSFAGQGGLVMGICNGFQVLIESQLLPGALLRNESTRFISRQVSLTIENNQTPFSHQFQPNQSITLPIAHKDGNYFAHPELIRQLEENHQIVLRYQNNPNGSTGNIAGICNPRGNVFGLMPHPERAFANWLGSSDGLIFFQSMLASMEAKS